MNSIKTIADESVYQPDTGIMDPTTVPESAHEGSARDDERYDEGEDEHLHRIQQDTAGARNDSPGRQLLEEELYKLRVKTGPGSVVGTHKIRGVYSHASRQSSPSLPHPKPVMRSPSVYGQLRVIRGMQGAESRTPRREGWTGCSSLQVADAIGTAVFNGRHSGACVMLRGGIGISVSGESITGLVSRCSNTSESLAISCGLGAFVIVPAIT